VKTWDDLLDLVVALLELTFAVALVAGAVAGAVLLWRLVTAS
jgi:nitrogen fixation-related uncharacterized protein